MRSAEGWRAAPDVGRLFPSAQAAAPDTDTASPNATTRPTPFRAANRYALGRSSPLPMGEGFINASTTTPSVRSCGNTCGSGEPGE